jgi:hypothetical protein
MKSFPLIFASVFGALVAFAQDSPQVVDPIADSTSPGLESPPATLDIKPEDILSTKVRDLGDRKLVIQKVVPYDLSAYAPSPESVVSVAVDETPAKLPEAIRETEFVFIGATVYTSKDQPDQPRTLVQLWPQGSKEPITCWSSANWNWLAGFGSFQGTDGRHYALIMSHSTEDVERMEELHQRFGGTYQSPTPPEFPAGRATFQVTSGASDAETLAPLQALHDLYNAESAQLQAAHEAREAANKQQEAERLANPPQPKDITLRYWRIPPPTDETRAFPIPGGGVRLCRDDPRLRARR